MPTRNLCLLLLLLLVPGGTALAQPGTFERGNFFEGTIQYRFETSGSLGESLEYYNPIKNMTFHIKKGDYIIHLAGEVGEQEATPKDPTNLEIPAFKSTRLFIADSNELYVVDARNQRAFKKEYYKKEADSIPVAHATGDSTTVAGYKCYGYRVDKPKEWIKYFCSPKIRANKAYLKGKDNSHANFLTQGLSGMIPLKTIRQKKKKDLRITITATRVKARELKTGQFRIPESFEILNQVDYRRR